MQERDLLMKKVILSLLFLFCFGSIFGENITINDLKSKGFSIIENQSFTVNFENWGKVRFISCEQEINDSGKIKTIDMVIKYTQDKIGYINDSLKSK
jgi:hypothetical protein